MRRISLVVLVACVVLMSGVGGAQADSPQLTVDIQQPTTFAGAVAASLAAVGLDTGTLTQPLVDHSGAPLLFGQFVSAAEHAWAAVDLLAELPTSRAHPLLVWAAWQQQTRVVAPFAVTEPCLPPVDGQAALPVQVPANIPWPLAEELQLALNALAQAEAWRAQAFRALPEHTNTVGLLASLPVAVFESGWPASDHSPTWQNLLPLVDHCSLHAGANVLLSAGQRLHRYVTQTAHLPPIYWRTETPMGTVLVDTTGQHNHHAVITPLLMVDVGGDDRYEFGTTLQPPQPSVRLLLDHGGDDHYTDLASAAGPSSAVMGLGLLWDTSGNDQYHGRWLAQGGAVLGIALHVDDGGHNTFHAIGMAQAFAFDGAALLLGSPGDDVYHAQTMSQASAGPNGAALMLEPAGHDSYVLKTEALLVWPSPQLPDRNTSLGQGAGFGVAGPGGVAALIDAAGNDTYRADVFAQGAGLRHGTGLLLDLAGHNQFNAAWYAMGAAAHRSVGVLWSAGREADQYQVSHVTAMGTGHDLSLGILVDAGGADSFTLGDLGLGVGHDGGHGLFLYQGVALTYTFSGNACRGMGTSHTSKPGLQQKGRGFFFAPHLPSHSSICSATALPSP